MSLNRFLSIAALILAPAVMQAASIQYQFGPYVFITPDYIPNLIQNSSGPLVVQAQSMVNCGYSCAPVVGRYYFGGLTVYGTEASAVYFDGQGTDMPTVVFQASYPSGSLAQLGVVASVGSDRITVSLSDAAPTIMPEPSTWHLLFLATTTLLVIGQKRRLGSQKMRIAPIKR